MVLESYVDLNVVRTPLPMGTGSLKTQAAVKRLTGVPESPSFPVRVLRAAWVAGPKLPLGAEMPSSYWRAAPARSGSRPARRLPGPARLRAGLGECPRHGCARPP